MSDVRWADIARRDLHEIDTYLREHDPAVADGMGRRLLAATALLADHPSAGAGIDDAGRHKWRVPRTPYVLVYRIDGAVVRILRVRHAQDDWRRT